MRNSEGSGGPQLSLPEGRLLVWVSGGNFFPRHRAASGRRTKHGIPSCSFPSWFMPNDPSPSRPGLGYLCLTWWLKSQHLTSLGREVSNRGINNFFASIPAPAQGRAKHFLVPQQDCGNRTWGQEFNIELAATKHMPIFMFYIYAWCFDL